MTTTPPAGRASPLVTVGFAALALGAILALVALSSAELENPGQTSMWATSGLVVGALGALLAALGAFRGARGA